MTGTVNGATWFRSRLWDEGVVAAGVVFQNALLLPTAMSNNPPLLRVLFAPVTALLVPVALGVWATVQISCLALLVWLTRQWVPWAWQEWQEWLAQRTADEPAC